MQLTPCRWNGWSFNDPPTICGLCCVLSTLLVPLFCGFFLQKWKIFEGDMLFSLKWQLGTEIAMVVYATVLAVIHLINGYLKWPGTMLQTTCRSITVYHSFFIRFGSWMSVWISIDRFVAVVMPKKYDLR